MSFLKQRGAMWYLYWYEKGGQRAIPISKDKREAIDYRIDFDHDRKCQRLGMINTRKMWVDLKAKFLKTFSERKKRNKQSTYTIYLDSFKRFELLAEPRSLASFTFEKALDFKNDLQNATYSTPKKKVKPYSDSTINITLRNIHAVFNLAVDLGWVIKNPFHKVKQINPGKKIPRNLSTDEMKRLAIAAKNSESEDAFDILLTYYYTGIRRTTLTILEKDMFDLKSAKLFMRRTPEWKPKNGDDAFRPLHPILVKMLEKRFKRIPEGQPLVFPGRNGKRDKNAIGRLFNALYRRAGIKARGVHPIRHTFITDLMQRNQPHIVKELADHSDLKTTMGYTHARDEELSPAINKLPSITKR